VIRTALAAAPVRVADCGGWTDTWFAGHGLVCSLAVGPGAEVRATGRPGTGTVQLHLPDFDDAYEFAVGRRPGRHPLLEAAIGRWAPSDIDLEITTRAFVPPGSGTGTSAAVVVALLAALDTVAGRDSDQADLARRAHEVETVELGWQCGIQDQLAAVHGGAIEITMREFPHGSVRPLHWAPSTRAEVAERMITVHLGHPHESSAIHRTVISHLADDGARHRLLEPIRLAARRAVSALETGDVRGWAEALRANTDAQRALHPGLVGPGAQAVIERADRHGAWGWKVNGAGGDGGTLTVIAGGDRAELVGVLGTIAGCTVLDVGLDEQGVVVREI
jgi:D-glycero-alpha-D-manno-heptose-7-phosphate kinase